VARALLVAGLLAWGATGSAACGDECTGDCGGALVVGWEVGDVPEADAYRICVDGTCESVDPERQEPSDPPYVLARAEARPDGPVEVRLDALRPDLAVVATYAGEGTRRTGGCCTALQMEVDGDRLRQHG
jgi:hypothetical protein